MPDFKDLQDWLGSIRETYTFLIAIPAVVALALACIAEWVEHYLTGPQGAASHRRGPAPTRQAVVAQDR